MSSKRPIIFSKEAYVAYQDLSVVATALAQIYVDYLDNKIGAALAEEYYDHACSVIKKLRPFVDGIAGVIETNSKGGTS